MNLVIEYKNIERRKKKQKKKRERFEIDLAEHSDTSRNDGSRA